MRKLSAVAVLVILFAPAVWAQETLRVVSAFSRTAFTSSGRRRDEAVNAAGKACSSSTYRRPAAMPTFEVATQ
jgi:hypothetical protein